MKALIRSVDSPDLPEVQRFVAKYFDRLDHAYREFGGYKDKQSSASDAKRKRVISDRLNRLLDGKAKWHLIDVLALARAYEAPAGLLLLLSRLCSEEHISLVRNEQNVEDTRVKLMGEIERFRAALNACEEIVRHTEVPDRSSAGMFIANFEKEGDELRYLARADIVGRVCRSYRGGLEEV